MPLDVGVRFGPYEVVAPLGAGGMGEVYRARDTKLNRDVALKVLPAAVSLDPDRLARFQREAETLAALNHPHIAAIYGLEDAQGTKALVMELVEGEDLSRRIARGRVPLEEALQYADQIAEALAAAHDHGIIHRDLKPANIQIRSDGSIKILDFGLAKAVDSAAGTSGAASMSPTLSVHATHAGVILGTAAYMAPEQARGRHVDRRADIWAFGAVLFEMLAGKRAFGPSARSTSPRAVSDDGGDDVSDTLVSVLRDEPDWDALPADVPIRVRQALRICLQKDPKKRVRDITAVRLAIEGAFETEAPTPATVAAAANRSRWPHSALSIGVGLVAGAAAIMATMWLRPAPSAPLEHFILASPPDAPVMAGGQNSSVAIAPNGRRIAYRTTQGRPDGAGSGVLFVRELDRPDATLVRGSETAGGGFFFSPDSEWIAFFANGDNTLKRVSVLGGPPQTICKLDAPWRGGSWGTDGTIVFATSSTKGLRRVPAGGGEPEILTKVDAAKGETDHILPFILPNHVGVVFTAWGGSPDRSRIMALSPDGTITELIAGGVNPQVTASGHLVYVSDGVLRAVPFNLSRLEVGRNPVSLVEPVAVGAVGGASYSIADDGTLVYVESQAAGPIGQRTMVWVDRQGKQEEIKVPPRAYTYARLSPDGTRVALDARDQQNDIWIFDLARETLTRLTTDPGLNRGPVWFPDGLRLAFSAEPRSGVAESIHWQKADGSGPMERLSSGSSVQFPSDISPDGKSLLFTTPTNPPFDLGLLRLEGERQERMLFATKSFSESNGAISRDGHWLAYQSNESSREEIYLVPFPDVTASKVQVSTEGGTRPLWSRDGRELFYYIAPDTIMSVPVTLGATASLGKPAAVVKGPYALAVNSGRHYDVSPDGKRFLLLKDVAPLPAAQPRAPQFHFVQHFDQELRRIK